MIDPVRAGGIICTLVLVGLSCGRLGYDGSNADGSDASPDPDGPPGIDAGANALVLTGVTTASSSNSLSVSVSYTGDANANAIVNLHFCNATDAPGCEPEQSTAREMVRNGNAFTLDVTGLVSPNDPGDKIRLVAVGIDPDGVIGSPASAVVGLGFIGCVVNSSLDASDLVIDGVCDAGGQTCTLRAAVAEANAGNCNAQILIGSQIAVDLTLGELAIAQSMTIHGESRTTSIVDGGLSSRVFNLHPGISVELASMTIQNGRDADIGGAIQVDTAELSLSFVTVQNSDVTEVAQSAFGGGVGVIGNSTLRVSRSSFINNLATGNKGGGAIGFRDAGTLAIVDSEFLLNGAETGAAVYTQSTGGTFRNTTFADNDTTVGGGQFAGAVDVGCAATGTWVFENLTFANNDSDFGGALFWCPAVTSNVRHCTFSNNTPADLHHFASGNTTTLTNNVFDDASVGSDDCSGFAGYVSGGGNVALANDAGCVLTSLSDQTGTDPLLGLLADNGGPNDTMALLDGSPALDAADLDSCLATDQRGVLRPSGKGCDSGAFEVAP